MLQVDNQTPFKTAITVFPDRRGIDTLYVVVKATVNLQPRLSLAETQVPTTLTDEYYGEPGTSGLRRPSDLHVGKVGTDVILLGSAWAPRGRSVDRMRVVMTAADRQKTILVSGDRVWRDGRPSEPKLFESMPLVWERAFGGVHEQGERVLGEERNPVGCGFAGGRSPAEMEGLPVPNLEDPAAPLRQLGQPTVPANLAPVAPSWVPRRAYAGTYDHRWERMRAPYLPDDFDLRFFQCAVPEFAFDRYLQAGESVHIAGATPDGSIAFTVPDSLLEIAVIIDSSTYTPPAQLETLSIEPDDNRVCFTWRAAMPCNRRVLRVKKVIVDRKRASQA